MDFAQTSGEIRRQLIYNVHTFMKGTKILAIGGHPDDMEQFAGGTLILLKKAGCDVTIAALTAGECGSKTVSGPQIKATRLKEATNAAKLIGAKYINLDIPDGSLDYNLESAQKVAGLIRDVNPDVIITHPVDDYMTDHFHAGRLVLWAVPEAGHPNFPTASKSPAITQQPYVYHTDPQGLTDARGQIVKVNTIVDISDVIEEKLKAFAAHKSQMGFLAHRNKPNAVEKTRRWAITRGEQVRTGFAEGFYQELAAEYPRGNILLELLPGKVYTL